MDDGADQIVIAHLSDTHFGPMLVHNHFSWFQGYAAHDLVLCLAVPLAQRDIRALLGLREDDALYVVVSGDLTCTGALNEFPVAHTFLRSQWHLRRTTPHNMIGLSAQNAQLADIPGNHDH